MIRVLKGTVKADGEKYTPGDIIYDLDERDELRLVSSKVAEPWGDINQTYSDESEVEKDHQEMQIPGAGRVQKPEQLTNKSVKETQEEKDPPKEEGNDKADQPLIGNSGDADKININFDAAAYVGETAPKKTKAGK